MSLIQETQTRCKSMFVRMLSNPRVQKVIEKPKKVYANAIQVMRYEINQHLRPSYKKTVDKVLIDYAK